MPSSARRTDPALWEAAKRAACDKGGLCAHSARKMQWAVQEYKKRGGSYKGRKSRSNSLVKWTRQKWRTEDGSPSEGRKRYLPDKAWKHLSPSQRRRTNAAKAKGRKQWVPQPKDVAKVSRRFRGPNS